MNLTDRERNMYLQRWEDATEQLINYLYKQRFENTKLASELTLLELPNIIAFLKRRSEFSQKNELKVSDLLSKLSLTQALLENIGCKQALKEIINLRQYIEKSFNDEGLIHFESELQNIEILLNQGDFKSAFDSTQHLSNYLIIQLDINKDNKKAKHHLPITYFLMGRALKLSGNTEKALFHLKNAQKLFEINNNIRMSIATMTDIGDCLQHSNKFSEAESLYLKSIDYSEKIKSIRDAAVARGQLARVYNFQGRFPKALLELKKSIHLFDEVHDAGAVATTYYHMGMLCRRIKH
ncbi:MAG TPA: tetratricopeptide repeat protein [Saprospiraceae bacterium]|nr:tetratricopeptide repeat protein [Saprospiraceae bacterium]